MHLILRGLAVAALLFSALALLGCDAGGDDDVIRLRGLEDGGVYTDRVRVEVAADADAFVHVDLRLFVNDSLGGQWQQGPPFVFEGFPFLDAFVGAGDIEVTACGVFREMRDGNHGACTAPVRVRVVEP
jgi:hypothetical protein